jgi:hypothetical protein
MSAISFKFECEYCGGKFKQESRFLKHECKEKKRHAEFNTQNGQLAYLIYKKWLLKNKHGVARKDSFLNSSYYRTFTNIARFVISVDIINIDMFVEFMVRRKYRPHIWTDVTAYTQFLEHLDNKERPKKIIDISINTIMKECDKRDISTSEFFNHLDSHDIIHLLETRKLSPWILFFSDKFKTFYRSKPNVDQKIIINSFLNVESWKKRFNKHPVIVKKVKVYIKELEL